MRRLAVLTLVFCILPPLAAEKLPKPDRISAEPTPEQSALIRQGVALHDQREYDAAITKYKLVLAENPWQVTALHELGLTYFESKKYQDALATAHLGVQCKSPLLPHLYVLMANSLDELGKRDDALAVYRAAIKQSPDVALLHYNLAVSLWRSGKKAEAKSAAERAIECDPNRPSSHSTLGAIYREMGYRVPAILAYSRFLMLEPDSPRAVQNSAILRDLLTGGVTRKDSNNINITVSDSSKGLRDEGDFTSTEMMISIIVAADFITKPDEPKTKEASPFDKLVAIYAGLGEALANSKPKGGFAARHYAPYFAELAKTGHTEAFVAQAWKASNLDGAAAWTKSNDAKLQALAAWSSAFHWPAK